MEIYKVGGCIRDELLGLNPKDIDYVVVGASPQELLDKGFKQVGADFPVFLHPETGDEYALARTERKSGVGYHGFTVDASPQVTLEEDLARRDLTINSMAKNLITGEIIDPFGGRADLAYGVIRHTSESFAEDPVRVLRAARFVARYGFNILPSTLQLMRVVAQELNHIPQERIWAEIEKGLGEAKPALMMEVLEECGALGTEALLPYSGWSTQLRSVSHAHSLSTRFSLVAGGFTIQDYTRCRIPAELAQVSMGYQLHGRDIGQYLVAKASKRLELLMLFRALANSSLLHNVIHVVAASSEAPVSPLLSVVIDADISACKAVNAAEIAKNCVSSNDIKTAVFNARAAAIAASTSVEVSRATCGDCGHAIGEEGGHHGREIFSSDVACDYFCDH